MIIMDNFPTNHLGSWFGISKYILPCLLLLGIRSEISLPQKLYEEYNKWRAVGISFLTCLKSETKVLSINLPITIYLKSIDQIFSSFELRAYNNSTEYYIYYTSWLFKIKLYNNQMWQIRHVYSFLSRLEMKPKFLMF